MGAHNETCSDTEFIQLWGQLESAARMAEHLQINIRAIHLRRRWIEQHYKITLGASDHRGLAYDNRPKSFSPLKQIDLGILDGTVIVFSDGTHLTEPSDNDLKAKLTSLGII